MIHSPIKETVGNRYKSNLFTQDSFYLILLSLLSFTMCLPLLTKYPAPGGDEPGFVDPAVTLATHGYIGTTLYQGLMPSMDQHVYWVPPFYFVVLAGWFHMFGIGLVQARAFSVLCAVAIVIFVYLLSRRWAIAGHSLFAGVLCATSFWLINRACFARMDTLCVALTLGSILIYQRANDSGRIKLYGVSGLLAGLAFLTHPLGVIPICVIVLHLLLSRKKAVFHARELYVILGSFGICVAAWVGYILQDYGSFCLQMHAQLERKNQVWSYWYQFYMAKTHAVSLLVALSACGWLIAKGWRATQSGILAISVIVAFAAATYGHEAGYFLYFYPLACVAIAVALSEAKNLRMLLYFCLVASLTNESVAFMHDVRRYHKRDYVSLTNIIRTTIPAGKSVYIGFAEVSPYFALLGRNPMRVAIPVPLPDPQAEGKVAQHCDFIVDSVPDPYLSDISALLDSRKSLVRIDQGPGYRITVFAKQ